MKKYKKNKLISYLCFKCLISYKASLDYLLVLFFKVIAKAI